MCKILNILHMSLELKLINKLVCLSWLGSANFCMVQSANEISCQVLGQIYINICIYICECIWTFVKICDVMVLSERSAFQICAKLKKMYKNKTRIKLVLIENCCLFCHFLRIMENRNKRLTLLLLLSPFFLPCSNCSYSNEKLITYQI